MKADNKTVTDLTVVSDSAISIDFHLKKASIQDVYEESNKMYERLLQLLRSADEIQLQ